jgi:hypothetical protein
MRGSPATLVADHLPLDSVPLQTENGPLGVRPDPGRAGAVDPELVHAGKQRPPGGPGPPTSPVRRPSA